VANYTKLIVWQKAHELALAIYKLTEAFPKQEMFGLTSQLRRAALSIPTNIVEGYNRRGPKDFSRFIHIARGSLAETQYLLQFAKEIGYFKCDISAVEDLAEEVGKLLWSCPKNLR
jgi:four helix bundle protein